jgi:CrcB protein
MLKTLFIIAAGGGIGSIARFLVQKYSYEFYPHPFPFGTWLVNLVGCFLIGIFYAVAEKGNILSPEWRLLLTTGFCGGFTTFSTFAFENVSLMKSGDFLYAGLYIAASVIGGILATYLGILLIKLL